MGVITYVGNIKTRDERIVLLGFNNDGGQYNTALTCESFFHSEGKDNNKIHLIQKIFYLFIQKDVLTLQRKSLKQNNHETI